MLPSEVASKLGLQPGRRVGIALEDGGLRLQPEPTRLARLYVEPTNQCNLACRTCIRNVWDEPAGMMNDATFERILDGLKGYLPPPTVFFGGFGEPLAHPDIAAMVARAKGLGCRVELITNATLLDEAMTRRLIAAGLDMLWVSLDGARPESYADVRLGATLPHVLANVTRFRDMRRPGHHPSPELGIAFVAMQRSIGDLPDLLRLASHLGASRFLVTNVLPYTAEMNGQLLYSRALNNITYLPSLWMPHLSLPKMDLDPITFEPLYQTLQQPWNVSFAGSNWGADNDRCPFIGRGAAALGWDGSISPCLPLLHDHSSFLNQRPRRSRRYVPGNVNEHGLLDIWSEAGHVAFRERVRAFDFPPCSFCGGCVLSASNDTDCFGNSFPSCGGCLWAQGVIRCP